MPGAAWAILVDMSAPAHSIGSRQSLEDIRPRLEQEENIELYDGVVVPRGMVSVDHGSMQVKLGALLDPYNRRPDQPNRPGGWWIMVEVDVHYPRNGDVYRHDLMGFRRDRHAQRPDTFPVEARPDWVCEILSESNARNDTVKKQRTLHAHGVPHYWLLDPMRRTLTVLRYQPEAYAVVLTAELTETVRAEPFEAIELSLPDLADAG